MRASPPFSLLAVWKSITGQADNRVPLRVGTRYHHLVCCICTLTYTMNDIDTVIDIPTIRTRNQHQVDWAQVTRKYSKLLILQPHSSPCDLWSINHYCRSLFASRRNLCLIMTCDETDPTRDAKYGLQDQRGSRRKSISSKASDIMHL